MGVEFSGVVTKLGKSASKFKEGDEVFGLAYGVCPLCKWSGRWTDK
jgi:NADPH:quinone reductase-like Zn-dependent oxidoreductase